MYGKSNNTKQEIVDEMLDLSNQDQAECIADQYSAISNQYEPIQTEEYLNPIN